jgi:NAD(P)-dependent dehydrogenase (short-subunit alcohol dehydrogenase family)
VTRSFAKKTVVVTGAGSGIGRETAFAFAELGAHVVLADVNEEAVERTALLSNKLGGTAEAHVVDVASESGMRRFAERVHEKVGAVDVIVNNAGIAVAGSFLGTNLSSWDRALGVNVKGVVHGCYFFLPGMVERGRGGHVVNVASLVGLVASKRLPVYVATKFAVVGFSEALRAELAPHRISVATICPGVVDTPITDQMELAGDLEGRDDFRARVSSLYRRRGYGPGRVAKAIVDAVEKRRALVPVTPESWALYYAKRLAPRLLESLMARDPFD